MIFSDTDYYKMQTSAKTIYTACSNFNENTKHHLSHNIKAIVTVKYEHMTPAI